MKNRQLTTAVVLATAGASVGVGFTVLGPGSPAQAAPSLSAVECSTSTRMFQLREGGTQLWYASVTGMEKARPTAYQWTKVGSLPKSRPGLAVAAHTEGKGSVQLLVTDRNGGLRSYSFNKDKRTLNSGTSLASGTASKPNKYGFSRLTSDGKRLYGVKGGDLYAMSSVTTTKAPTGYVKVAGFNTSPVAFFGNAGSDWELGWTDSRGNLHYSDLTAGKSGWTERSLTVREKFGTSRAITSAGGGVVLRRSGQGVYRSLVADPSRGSSVSSATKVSSSYPADAPITTVPDACAVKTGSENGTDVTYNDLKAMFGSRLGDKATVEQGLPSLNAAMKKGRITTPARKAAFLATLVSESNVRYNAGEVGNGDRYRGRGFIQLTNDFNYKSAGSYLGVDLLGTPSRAASLKWSAPISRWYWTKERPNTNSYADAHDMGRVSIAIGFDGSENPNHESRQRRCADFKTAYKHFAGKAATGVTC